MLGTAMTPAAYGHFAMPRSFYALTFASAIGYFFVAAGHSLLRSWRTRYREALSEPRTPMASAGPVPAADVTLIIGALFDFFSQRLWWWFAPALSVLALLVGLVMYTREAVIAVTPFIYTLF